MVIQSLELRTPAEIDLAQDPLQKVLLYLQTGAATLQYLAEALTLVETDKPSSGNLSTLPFIQPETLLYLEIVGDELFDLIWASSLLEVIRANSGYTQLLNLRTVVTSCKELERSHSAHRRLLESQVRQLQNSGTVRPETLAAIAASEREIRESFDLMRQRLTEFHAARALPRQLDNQNLLTDGPTMYSRTA